MFDLFNRESFDWHQKQISTSPLCRGEQKHRIAPNVRVVTPFIERDIMKRHSIGDKLIVHALPTFLSADNGTSDDAIKMTLERFLFTRRQRTNTHYNEASYDRRQYTDCRP